MKMSEPATSLSDKHSEPLIIRKYQYPFGFPVFVALICGEDLSDLDDLVDNLTEQWNKAPRGIQNLRNFFGNMANKILQHYGKSTEGVAVIAFADKCVIASLWGDFMTHHQCRLELYSLLNMTTQV